MPSVRTNDVDTYYQRDGEGPPVVLAHGAGFDHRWWEPQVDALADDYELIRYDLRGHGRTGGGGDWHQYEMELYALDLHRLIEALDLDRPVVVGHSLGGMFLPAFAARYPDSVRGVVLADAQVTPGEGLDEWFFRNVVHPASILTNRVLGPEWASRFNRVVGRLLSDEDDDVDDPAESDPELAAYQEDVERFHEQAEMTRVQRGLRRFPGAPLEAVSAPTLGVYGSLERDLMARNERALADRVSDGETREVPDAGHALTWSHAEAFNEALEGLLDRVTDA